jgi:hypothetical protein
LDLEDGQSVTATVGHGMVVEGWVAREAGKVEVGEVVPTHAGWKKVDRTSVSRMGKRVTVATSSRTLLVNGVVASTLCQHEFADGQRLEDAVPRWLERHVSKWT